MSTQPSFSRLLPGSVSRPSLNYGTLTGLGVGGRVGDSALVKVAARNPRKGNCVPTIRLGSISSM